MCGSSQIDVDNNINIINVTHSDEITYNNIMCDGKAKGFNAQNNTREYKNIIILL